MTRQIGGIRVDLRRLQQIGECAVEETPPVGQ
jgi:hypothetical protein